MTNEVNLKTFAGRLAAVADGKVLSFLNKVGQRRTISLHTLKDVHGRRSNLDRLADNDYTWEISQRTTCTLQQFNRAAITVGLHGHAVAEMRAILFDSPTAGCMENLND